jgi:hypothetical protein
MSERLNPSDYRLPVLDVTMAVALATALLSAAPKQAPDNVQEALDEVRTALAALEQRRGEQRVVLAPTPEDPRPIDNLVDAVWSAFFEALTALAALPAELYPRAAEAAALKQAIFPGSTPRAFLKLRYAAEWSEVKAHLDLIDKQKLGPRIDALLGPEFLAEIRRTFELYGAALGITTPATSSPSPDGTLEPLRALNAALNHYVISALSMVRRSQPGSRELIEAALEPIGRLRRIPQAPAPAEQSTQDAPAKPESLAQGLTPQPPLPASGEGERGRQ